MTILQSKSSQQGDSDDPPPKKKLKIGKSSIRGQAQVHAVIHPTTSFAPGPSHHQRDLYSFYSPAQSASPQFFGGSDHTIHYFRLDKFDVPIPPHPETPAPSEAVKKDCFNPNSLEYYIYGQGAPSSQTAKSVRAAPKRPIIDVNAIEVISSEEIEEPPLPTPSVLSEPGSLLDDINNFDFDDKFGELEKFQQDTIWEDSKTNHVEKPLDAGPLMNGYENLTAGEGLSYGGRALRTSPTAALSNLGNTCFLNSVLYTLRFAPNFLHNLHHLVTDMNSHATTEVLAKKTASLNRNLGYSISKKKEKEVCSGAGDLSANVKTKKQIVTEQLHSLYESMNNAEARDHNDPLQPEVFLTALREVNPIFEGNQQQDAHELLVCLLDIFREACQASARQAETRAAFDANSQGMGSLTLNGDKKKGNRLKIMLKKITRKESWKNEKNLSVSSPGKPRDMELHHSDASIPDAGMQHSIDYRSADEEKGEQGLLPATFQPYGSQQFIEQSELLTAMEPPAGLPRVDNFVAQDFEGVMVLRTTCLECENTTEKNEPFADICVPIKTDSNDDDEDSGDGMQPSSDSDIYQKAVVTDEYLREWNKYYCDECKRYNEARRSVRYQTLPRLLTLQLKRFSSTYGAMSKVTKYMPTPMTLACFCEECRVLRDRGSHHDYELYGVIMHLGPNMAGGHYITYVRMSSNSVNYRYCTKDLPRVQDPVKPILSLHRSPQAEKFSNGLAGRPSCRAQDCCGVGMPEVGKYDPDASWIACDDDIVKVLSRGEVEAVLSKHSTSNATPYLLFYARTE